MPHEPATEEVSGVRPTARRWALYGLLVALGLILVGVGAVYLLLKDTTVAVVRREDHWYPANGTYAGVGACIGCHGAIVEQQQASAHAKSVRRLGRGTASLQNITGKRVVDPLTGAAYQMERGENGRDRLALRSGGLEAFATLEWEFGSGHRAHGYLARAEDGSMVDTRLNWYRSINDWDFTSGQEKPTRTLLEQPLGRPLPKPEIARCFGCHSTELRATRKISPGATHAQVDLDLDRSTVGIQCEGCHGPMGAHVDAVRRKAAPARKGAMTADEVNQMCGACHSRSDIDPQHSVLARFQPWGFVRSRCFKESKGRLSCLTCHDPHGDASRDATYYDARCLSCHSSQAVARKESTTICRDKRTSQCASCHMPRDTESMRHTPFTDHWIRTVRD